jgi:hypothetical protein
VTSALSFPPFKVFSVYLYPNGTLFRHLNSRAA